MPLNEISAFHPLVIIGMGFAFAIIWFVTKHGFGQGGASVTGGGENKSAAQVVAISVDTKTLDRLNETGLRLAASLESFDKNFQDRTEKTERRIEDLTDSLKQTNYELRELSKEVRSRP